VIIVFPWLHLLLLCKLSEKSSNWTQDSVIRGEVTIIFMYNHRRCWSRNVHWANHQKKMCIDTQLNHLPFFCGALWIKTQYDIFVNTEENPFVCYIKKSWQLNKTNKHKR
jgi:hypothetical protein